MHRRPENGLEADVRYRPTHETHPVTRWATASRANWLRLREHARALNAEFRERYETDADHASWAVIARIDPGEISFPDEEPTPRPQAMPDRYRRPGEPVAAYRAYYANEKADWGAWRYTAEPPWLEAYRRSSEGEDGDRDGTGGDSDGEQERERAGVGEPNATEEPAP